MSKSFAGKTFADISKELDKIINENKFDNMSRRTFEEMTRRLQQAQEDKKFQEKQEEIVEFVNGNSDYENNALKQQMQQNIQEQQEAAAQEEIAAQQAAEEQAMQDSEAQMQMQVPDEKQQSPSAYDQMMSRAQITDAANQGMFGYGGILHQNENSWARTLAKA